MIYPINIKKKIKESRHLKENVRSVASIAAWLKDSIAAMTANQELTISRRILDSNFGFYVYWTQGFDVNDDSVIHADADKTYGLVAALKCRNDAEWDGEYMDSPYDPETGDLYCEDYELSPKDNTEMVAEWLLEDYDSMVELMNNNPETVIGGLKESKTINEDTNSIKEHAITQINGKFKSFFGEYGFKVRKEYTGMKATKQEGTDLTFYIYYSDRLDAPSQYNAVLYAKIPYTERTLARYFFTINVNDITKNLDTLDKIFTDPEFLSLLTWTLPNIKKYLSATDESNTLGESKSIKEGLSAKEVLEQAKKLLEK